MPQLTRILLATACLLLLVSCDKKKDSREHAKSPAPALAPISKAEPKSTEPEWTSLFDGKTLGKWKPSNFGGGAQPRIENSSLILPVGASLSGVTYSGDDIPKINYEIELDAQRVDGSDFFCGLTFPVKDSHASLILGGWAGSLCGISSLDGEDASSNQTCTSISFKTGQWYHVRMRVLENRLDAWLDDKQIVEVDTTGKKIDIRIEVSESRPLGLATYETTGAIKNIRIRKVDPNAK